MASTARSITLLAVVLIALIATGVFYIASNLNGIVAGLIEEQGSAATLTTVSVDGVDIKLSEASAALSGLTVANPEGFAGNAIELGGFSAALDASSLTSDTIVVKDVTVDGARINVLQQGTQNNLRQLMANLDSGAETTSSSSESSKKLIIQKFTLRDASASVSLPNIDEVREVELPPIVVRNIGSASEGASGAQIAKQLLGPVIEAAISSATAGAIKEEIGGKVNEAVGGFLKGLSKKKDEQE